MSRKSNQSSASQSKSSKKDHFLIVRDLLRRDYLTTADWERALRDYALMAKEALDASETFVALYKADQGAWTACSSGGQILGDSEISLFGSRSILEKVRKTRKPILTTQDTPLPISTESIVAHGVQSVLALPLSFWDAKKTRPRRHFAGCLYVHRGSDRGAFDKNDIELARDLTEIVQRTLNLLRHMQALETVLEASREELGDLRLVTAERFHLGEVETADPWFAQTVLEPLRRVSYAKKVNLLFLGPPGAGKTHLARAYHYQCPRRDGPFIVLDCSQILSAQTLGPELFGYAKDSGYANAPRKGMPGKAELAHKGTLFIDEIGCLPSSLQQRLLRLIQTGCFSSLGSSEEKEVDIQIIAATNEDLPTLVRQGRFRADLLQRIQEVTIRLPSLNQRPQDIAELASLFLSRACARFERDDVQVLTEEAVASLVKHDWSHSGNVRGLEQTLNRSVLLAPRPTWELDAENLEFGEPIEYVSPLRIVTATVPVSEPPGPEPPSRPPAPGRSPEELIELMQRKIREHGGVIAEMSQDDELARAFGYSQGYISTSTLRLRIRTNGLSPLVEEERKKRRSSFSLERIKEAVVQHGGGSAAARALGIKRDRLIWQLRKAGLTVRDILAGS